jgi:cephalosporin hydroxylase
MIEEWVRKKGLMVGPKSDTEDRVDENGEVLSYSPIKVSGSWNGCGCKHVVSDFPKIREIIETVRPETIVELGTRGGGVTAFFSDIVRQWNGTVHTFDYIFGCKTLLQKCDNVKFHEADVVGNGPIEEVIEVINKGTVLLYCDNGHKEKEVEIYSKYLNKGSVIGCHDYDTEVNPFWINSFLEGRGFKKFHNDELRSLYGTVRCTLSHPKKPHATDGGSLTRFWIKDN